MQTNTIRKHIDLNADDVEWFYSTFHDANLSAVLSELLHHYRNVTEHTPEYYMKLAAEVMKNDNS